MADTTAETQEHLLETLFLFQETHVYDYASKLNLGLKSKLERNWRRLRVPQPIPKLSRHYNWVGVSSRKQVALKVLESFRRRMTDVLEGILWIRLSYL